MNANENLEKKRKDIIVMVVSGAASMSIGLIPIFYFYAIVIPANYGKGWESIPGILFVSAYIGALIFVSGFILFLIGLIGLLVGLIGRLKKSVRARQPSEDGMQKLRLGPSDPPG
jgi:hypothetical protein